MNQINNTSDSNDEINLKDLFNIILNKKLIIISIPSFAAVLSVVVALLLPNIYTSSSLLAPTSQDESLSSNLGGLSGLAGLAGVNLPAGSVSDSQIAVKRIESLEFFSKYFLPNIKIENLMAVKEWKPQDNKLTYYKSWYDSESDKWVRKASYPKKTIPSAQESFKEYKKLMSINQDEESGLVSISIKHKSPIIAKKWMDIIIFNINKNMREIDKKDAENSIAFLSQSSKSTSIQSIKEVTSKLLEAQMQTLMLASTDDDYVFKTINSPIVPEEKSSPNRPLICIMGSILGFIMSMVIVLIMHARQNPIK